MIGPEWITEQTVPCKVSSQIKHPCFLYTTDIMSAHFAALYGNNGLNETYNWCWSCSNIMV